MTQQAVHDSVMLRADQMRVALSLSTQTILNLMNYGIRDTVIRTLPYFLEFYEVDGFNIMGAANKQFPINMLGSHPIRVVATDPDDASLHDARYCSPQEFYTVNQNSRNPPANYAPIYTIWGDTTPHQRVFRILPATIVTCVADIWQSPADLAIDTSAFASIIGVPAGYEIAVVYRTLALCLQKLNQTKKMETAFKSYAEEVGRLTARKKQEMIARREQQQILAPTNEALPQ